MDISSRYIQPVAPPTPRWLNCKNTQVAEDFEGGGTALICTSQNGHVDCARLLLDAGADKEATDKVRARGGVLRMGLVTRGECNFHVHFSVSS